jgi:hypothetical protein
MTDTNRIRTSNIGTWSVTSRGHGWSEDFDSPTVTRTSFKYCSDYTHPGYHRRIKAGEIISSPKTAYTLEYFLENEGYLEASNGPGLTNVYTGTVVGRCIDREKSLDDIYNDINPDALLSAVSTQAYADAHAPDLDLPVVAAHYKRLGDLFTGAGKRLAHSLSDFGKKHGYRRSNLDNITDLYLESRFGWRIAWKDVLGAQRALQRPFTVRRAIHSKRHGSTSGSDSWTEGIWFKSDACTVSRNWSSSFAIGAHLLTERVASVTEIAERYGLTNPFYAMWDYVPYSFVVDWFLNVGPWIQSLSPQAGLSILASNWTAKGVTISAVNAASSGGVSGGSSFTSGSLGSYRVQKRTNNRGILSGPSSHPVFDVHFDPTRALDAVFLVNQVLRRFK